jgi:hypothetical protein
MRSTCEVYLFKHPLPAVRYCAGHSDIDTTCGQTKSHLPHSSRMRCIPFPSTTREGPGKDSIVITDLEPRDESAELLHGATTTRNLRTTPSTMLLLRSFPPKPSDRNERRRCKRKASWRPVNSFHTPSFLAWSTYIRNGGHPGSCGLPSPPKCEREIVHQTSHSHGGATREITTKANSGKERKKERHGMKEKERKRQEEWATKRHRGSHPNSCTRRQELVMGPLYMTWYICTT